MILWCPGRLWAVLVILADLERVPKRPGAPLENCSGRLEGGVQSMIEGDLKVYGGYFSVDVYPFPERFVGARDRLVIRWDFVKGGLGRKCLYRKFGHVPSVKTRVEDSATNRQNVIWKERCF